MNPASNGVGLEVSVRLAERGLDVELTVGPGEVLAVLGPNGAGKSTLLDIVAGLVRPDDGYVRLARRTLTDISKGVAVPAHRREVSLLAQDPLLFPHLSVAANVAFGPRSRGLRARTPAALAREWLRAVGAVTLAERRPAALSGGQAQRVALARALAVEPRVVLLDEPMAALDVSAAPAMRSLLRQVLRSPERKASGPSTILVTHDIVDALTLADRVLVLESGRIVEQGPVAEVLSRPRSTFAARIAGVDLMTGLAVAPATSPGDDTTAADRVRAAGLDEPRLADSVGRSGRDATADDGACAADRDEPPPADSVGRHSRSNTGVPQLNLDRIATSAADTTMSQGDSSQHSGAVQCGSDIVHGRCEGTWLPGVRAAAVFSPAAVAVYRDHPTGSPRNVFRVRVAELTDRGGVIRVHAADRSDGTPGLVADLTPAAVAELELTPGMDVHFSVKASEVQVYPC